MPGDLRKTVGVVLVLKGVFLEFDAFVKGIANAPVDDGFKGALTVRAAGQQRVGRAEQRRDLRGFGGFGI